jgi:hypothetical protein
VELSAHAVTDLVLGLLRGLPGVVAAAGLDEVQRTAVVEREEEYEASALLPVRNIGVQMIRDRRICCVILKDARFRPPRAPTVYLAEEGASEGSPHAIVVEGVRYAIVGQEVVEGAAFDEPTVSVEDSFVIFPERRTGPAVPCRFILPPVAFPELEAEAQRLGIEGIVSISPSLAADGYLRQAFGFPPTNALATLLVGCNPRP